MRHSESIAKLATALVSAQRDLKAVGKDATNPHFKFKYATLDNIIEAIRPVLGQHGLAVVQGVQDQFVADVESGAVKAFSVETMLIHASGEWIANSVIIPLGKNDAQGAGGALTYGRRYGLSALLSLATDEDDGGNTAVRPATQRAASQPPKAGAVANAIKPKWADDKSVEYTPEGAWIINGVPISAMYAADLTAVKKVADKKGYADLSKACGTLLTELSLAVKP